MPDFSRRLEPALKPLCLRAVRTVAWNAVRGCGYRCRAARRATTERLPGRKWTCTSSPQSVGGPRAGETGGGSSGSPRCVRIFRIGPGSVMNAMSRMSPPHPRARKRKLLAHRGMSLAHAIREVSWEGRLSHESHPWPLASPSAACPPTACPPVAASRGLPTFPMASAVTADLSL
jgi:hypothetical protein